MMFTDDLWHNLAEVLKQTRGYFVFGEAGSEYVVTTKREFEQRTGAVIEQQLNLLEAMPRSSNTADEMLDKINRDIALYHLQQAEERLVGADEELPGDDQADELSAVTDDLSLSIPPGGRRLRFESLRGDLPPELQE